MKINLFVKGEVFENKNESEKNFVFEKSADFVKDEDLLNSSDDEKSNDFD